MSPTWSAISSTRCSSALWSAVSSILSHASMTEVVPIVACPVTATEASVDPGCAPKSIVVVPDVPTPGAPAAPSAPSRPLVLRSPVAVYESQPDASS